MRFTKIKHISWQHNSDHNKLLRQQWTLAFLGLHNGNKVLINIDESWIDYMDYRRRKWQYKGVSNSLPRKQVVPTLSLILAIDTLGNCWASITQVTTTSKLFMIYLNFLVKKLDSERPGWRNNTVILMDGALYHQSDDTLAHMKSLQLPVMFFGPASYNVAPVELMFGLIKAVQLNPDGLSTGK